MKPARIHGLLSLGWGQRALTAAVCAGLLAGPTAASVAGEAGGPAPARRPGVSFLLSLVLPGAGQLYNGDKRGYAYLAVDAATWFARLSYLNAGDKREGQSRDLANAHWFQDLYKQRGTATGCADCCWTATDSLNLSTLSGNARDRYYSELTKAKYLCGWDDFEAPGGSGSWGKFRKMRQQSDDLRRNAKLVLVVAVLNRVVSGVDALRTARTRSADAPSHALRWESDLRGTRQDPQAVLRLVMEVP